MFNINSPQAILARNIVLAGLGADPIEHCNCKCASDQTSLSIKRVIYNDPATVIYWSDDTRTVVKCQPGDKFDPELGFLLAVCKKVCGNNGRYNELLRKHVPGYGGGGKNSTEPGIEQMRKELDILCRTRRLCRGCPLDENGFECGRGKYFFLTPADESGYMTDESIVKHYRAMKGAKS